MPYYARHAMLNATGEPLDSNGRTPGQAETPTIDRYIDIGGKSPAEIARILRMRIEELDRRTDGRYGMDYCSGQSPNPAADYYNTKNPIAEGYRWIACYPVTGGSEGHYLHLDLIYQRDADGRPLDHDRHVQIALIKVFGGWDAAAELAGIIGRWLDA